MRSLASATTLGARAGATAQSVPRYQTSKAVDMAWTVAVLLFALTACVAAADQAEAEAEAQQQAQRAVAVSNNAFSFDFYQMLRSEPGNLIMSSFSALAALAMVLQGAGGETARQLQTALRLPEDPAVVQRGFKALMDGLQTNDEIIMRVANKVFTRKGAHIKAPFRSIVTDKFRSGAEELDFQRETEKSRVAINSWVEQITDNKIQNLLSSLDPATLMVLVNAIYFKGTWAEAFEEFRTRNETFHTSTTTQVMVPMMHQTSRFRILALPDLGARILELPYKGRSMKMLVILPDAVDGLSRVEQGLSQINLTKINQDMVYKKVEVSLPKFKIESKFELQEKLPSLGIRNLFGPGANLTGITDDNVMVSQVVQKAFVEVTEKGTTAAAATAVLIVAASAMLPDRQPPEIFKIDHPFLFILVSSRDVVTFMGRVERP